MKFYPVCFLCALSLTLLSSCGKKHEDSQMVLPASSIAPNDYATLYPGNYWIYELYNIDSLGNATPTGQYDSSYVLPDTTVNGKNYHVLMITQAWGMAKSPLLLRDSLQYMVDEKGQVHFAINDFTTLFDNTYRIQAAYAPHDSIGMYQTQMADENLPVTVPAGSFTTRAFRQTFFMHPWWIPTTGAIRQLYDRYAFHIGIVSKTLGFYPGLKTGEELRLVRYHVIYPVAVTR
jgi:hypothetical protein